jgi:type I site-specific restriction endonuclease
MTTSTTPEALARLEIDKQLEAAGWQVQDYRRMNLFAGQAVAVREFPEIAEDLGAGNGAE